MPQPRDPWDFWNSHLKAPKYVMGPMVNQSELQFRLLTRKYGTHLAYTPMIHSRLFATENSYREKICPLPVPIQDRPLVAQLCGNDPNIVLSAALLLQDHVDAIDLNCGCPQGIAKKGNYGSFLLDTPQVILNVVRELVEKCSIPIFVKIRLVHPTDYEPTLDLCAQLQNLRVSAICIHARHRTHNKHLIKQADWNFVKLLVQTAKIPIISNGSVSSLEEADECLKYTGAAAVMSAEAILEYPALFCTHKFYDIDYLMLELVDLYEQYPHKPSLFCLKAHLWHSLHAGLQEHTHLREVLANCQTTTDYRGLVLELQRLRQDVHPTQKLGWYFRHRKLQNPLLDDGCASN